jgi:hypothetical protein
MNKLAKALAKQVGSDCSRCFLESCYGSSTGWRDAPCAQEGSAEFVSFTLCQVLFHPVKHIFDSSLEKQSKSVVKNVSYT